MDEENAEKTLKAIDESKMINREIGYLQVKENLITESGKTDRGEDVKVNNV